MQASLLTISLRRLGTNEERRRLFEAASGHGFFYLDLRGDHILEQIEALRCLQKALFDLPQDEKLAYDVAGREVYFGYVNNCFLCLSVTNGRATGRGDVGCFCFGVTLGRFITSPLVAVCISGPKIASVKRYWVYQWTIIPANGLCSFVQAAAALRPFPALVRITRCR